MEKILLLLSYLPECDLACFLSFCQVILHYDKYIYTLLDNDFQLHLAGFNLSLRVLYDRSRACYISRRY